MNDWRRRACLAAALIFGLGVASPATEPAPSTSKGRTASPVVRGVTAESAAHRNFDAVHVELVSRHHHSYGYRPYAYPYRPYGAYYRPYAYYYRPYSSYYRSPYYYYRRALTPYYPYRYYYGFNRPWNYGFGGYGGYGWPYAGPNFYGSGFYAYTGPVGGYGGYGGCYYW